MNERNWDLVQNHLFVITEIWSMHIALMSHSNRSISRQIYIARVASFVNATGLPVIVDMKCSGFIEEMSSAFDGTRVYQNIGNFYRLLRK